MTSFAGQQMMEFRELKQKFISIVQFPHFSTEHVLKSAVEAFLLLHKEGHYLMKLRYSSFRMDKIKCKEENGAEPEHGMTDITFANIFLDFQLLQQWSHVGIP